MSGYFDQTAEAHANGAAMGRINGRAQGFEEGQQHGYRTGYDSGWTDAITRANAEIEKQIAYTRKHVIEKEALTQQLNEQRRLIELLQAKVDVLEAENSGLREVVTALQTVNEELRTEVAQLNDKAKESMFQLNRCAVFMSSARAVLEDLTSSANPDADGVRTLFAKRYAEHMGNALKMGAIKAPLETDEALGRAMPQTQKFIRDMLSAVQQHKTQEIESAQNEESHAM